MRTTALRSNLPSIKLPLLHEFVREAPLGVVGQGIVAVEAQFGADPRAELLFVLGLDDPGSRKVFLSLTPGGYQLRHGDTGNPVPIQATNKLPSHCRLIPNSKITYWLSIDKNNGLLRFGTGYLNTHNVAFEVSLKTKNEELRRHEWTEEGYSFIGSLSQVKITKTGIDAVRQHHYRNPSYFFAPVCDML